MPWLSSQLTVLGTKAGADASAATSAPAKPEPGVRPAYQRDRTHVYRTANGSAVSLILFYDAHNTTYSGRTTTPTTTGPSPPSE